MMFISDDEDGAYNCVDERLDILLRSVQSQLYCAHHDSETYKLLNI
jgi:hypothetical protein